MKYVAIIIFNISSFFPLFCQEEIDSLLIQGDFDSCGNVLVEKPFLTETDIKNNFTIFYFHLDDSIHLDMLKTLPMQAVPTEMFKKMPYYNNSDDDYLSFNENYLCPDDGCVFFVGKMISFHKEVSSYLFMVKSYGIVSYDLFNFRNDKLISIISIYEDNKLMDIHEMSNRVSTKIYHNYFDDILKIIKYTYYTGVKKTSITEYKIHPDATILCRELVSVRFKDLWPDE
jgi:hypothetical protein